MLVKKIIVMIVSLLLVGTEMTHADEETMMGRITQGVQTTAVYGACGIAQMTAANLIAPGGYLGGGDTLDDITPWAGYLMLTGAYNLLRATLTAINIPLIEILMLISCETDLIQPQRADRSEFSRTWKSIMAVWTGYYFLAPLPEQE